MAWRRRLRFATALLVAAVIAFLGFLLSLDNATPVALRLLNRETEPVPVFWWLYAAFALGLVVGFALAGFRRVSRRLAARRSRQSAGTNGLAPAPANAAD